LRGVKQLGAQDRVRVFLFNRGVSVKKARAHSRVRVGLNEHNWVKVELKGAGLASRALKGAGLASRALT
jgi:hypothetical protein